MSQNALLVAQPEDRAFQITPFERTDQTSTRHTITLADPAAALRIGYSDIGSAVGRILYVVLNATSDADAATKLALAGQRFAIPLGESRTFPIGPDALLTRIDLATNVASETGDSLITGEYGVLL